MSHSPANPTQQTKAMLAVVWNKNRDLLLHRLDTIESFCRQLPDSASDVDLRSDASSDAHKLAGSLGMFGLSEGTSVAREIEYRLREDAADALLTANIPGLASQLRSLIEKFHVTVAEPEPERRRKLLIVEGDPVVARGIAATAEKRGIESRTAVDLPGARQLLQEDRFDVLVLDLATAQLSGNPAVEDESDQVRDLILSRAPMQVLALTSEDTFEDRVTAAQVGAHGFLPKTVPVMEIVDTCEHLLDLQSAQFKVLIVDDDVAVLNAIQVLLDQHSIRVTSLADPRLFWSILEETSPDLVILDLEMPNFSGLELCRAIRNDSHWNRLPVLFLSSTSDALTVTGIFSAGADDFVAKPIIDIELITRVRNRLDRDRLYRNLSDYDPLTSVRNRRSSNVVIANYLRLAERHGLPLSLAVIDLDKFKRVNDTYGHQAGDDVLQHLGSLLRQSFRSEDVVARWGGEEFVVAMFAMRRGDAIERMAHVLEGLEAHAFEASQGVHFHVSFSAGLSEFPADGKDLHSLYRVADEALYRAKAAGGRRIYSQYTEPAETQAPFDIAVVCADVAVSAPLRHVLEMRGYSVELYQSVSAALQDLAGAEASACARAVLVEPPLATAEFLRKLRAQSPAPVVIVLGEIADPGDAGVEVLQQPYKLSHLMQRLRRILPRS
ncbi:response regulator receiver modulated diguanylate cyclase [Candidatus Koribacter versatilis Ellin345]|uniref:diguanylate cyclase n=1 Tax=Koribacter versatilis (strain Ellin345) TaxID=204669 RepID=Q1IKU4_KORVE|nr:diguanylate cyclase [Candidatus Koribacter versatilis]ABF42506.1 response regulator receiver modulated diguanylate cyclase [Candidatus Koribacter versatilis Ellin345]